MLSDDGSRGWRFGGEAARMRSILTALARSPSLVLYEAF